MIRTSAALPFLLLLAGACASPLTRAAKLGRADEIRTMLPSELKHCGPALNEAAANDHEDALKALLDGGCGVDSKDPDGYTALMAAAARGNDGCVRLLLERKADVELRSWNDKTAAMLARRAGHKETVKLLERIDGLPLPVAVKKAEPREAAEEVRASALSSSPREYMGKLVLVRGRVQKVVGASGREYGFGLAEPGKVYSGARGASSYVPLSGEQRIGVSNMVMLVDDQGGKCAFIFREGMPLPPAGQAASLAGRFLGDRLRAATSTGASSLAPGVYLEAAKD